MLGTIVTYAIAAACVLFAISLPLGKLTIGATLRRCALALAILAFAPSLFFGILNAPAGPRGGGTESVNALTVLGGFTIFAVLAYVILAIRKRLRTTAKDAWSEYVHLRSSGKRPVGADARTSAAPSLFDEEEP